MLLKHIYQELRKYQLEFDTNVVGIKKIGNEIVFEIKEKGIDIKTELIADENVSHVEQIMESEAKHRKMKREI